MRPGTAVRPPSTSPWVTPRGWASRPNRSTPSPCGSPPGYRGCRGAGRSGEAPFLRETIEGHARGEVLQACHPRPSGPSVCLGWSPPANPGAGPGSGCGWCRGLCHDGWAVVASWPAEFWPRSTVTEGEGGATGRGVGGARVVEPRDWLPGPGVWHLGVPIGTHADGVPSSPAAPAATPTTSPPPWPDRGLALGPGEGGRDALCRGAVLQRGEGRGGGTRRSGTGRASTVTSSGPCRPLPGWPRSQARRRGKGCPSGLVSVTVPAVRRRLVVALPLPAHARGWPQMMPLGHGSRPTGARAGTPAP